VGTKTRQKFCNIPTHPHILTTTAGAESLSCETKRVRTS